MLPALPLLAKNRVIASTLIELQKLYDSLDRDLIEARKLQQTPLQAGEGGIGRSHPGLSLDKVRGFS